MTCGIRDDGTLYFLDKTTGAVMSDYWVELAKEQNREAVLGLIERTCIEINGQLEAVGRLHHDTPDCRIRPQFVAPAFEEEAPTSPSHHTHGFFDRLIASRGQRVDAANRDADELHDAAVSAWRKRKQAFDREIEKRKTLIESAIYQDVGAMENFLEESLHDIFWPRETSVDFEIKSGGLRAVLDVDLPELEDMPKQTAAVPARGLKLRLKDMTASKVLRLYAEHVHGVIFRLVGEVFAALPKVQVVIASGYTQRRDPATAQLRDEYVLSVRVMRADWELNDFSALHAIDVTAGVARHDLRRDMLKSGLLKTIVPHDT